MTDPIVFLSVEDVLELHADQLHHFGGLDGIRDRAGLESAVGTPQATFAGQFLHADVFHMAAAYAFHLAESQAFVDGNKRVGLSSALVFLYMNGWNVVDPNGRLYDAMLRLSSKQLDKSQLAALFEKLAEPVIDD